MSEKKQLKWEGDYQIGSGATFTCAKIASRTCNLFAAADDQCNLIFWRIQQKKPKLTLTGQKTYASCLSFTNDQKKFFSGTSGGTVHVWDLEHQSEIVKLQGHLKNVTALARSDDDCFLVTGSQDTKVKLWDLRGSQNISTFREHKG